MCWPRIAQGSSSQAAGTGLSTPWSRILSPRDRVPLQYTLAFYSDVPYPATMPKRRLARGHSAARARDASAMNGLHRLDRLMRRLAIPVEHETLSVTAGPAPCLPKRADR